MKRTLKHILRALGLGAVLGLVPLLTAALYTQAATAPFRYSASDDVPSERVAVVFGAGVRGDRPSRILAERIDGAVALYRLGRVSKLLMTGDNSRADYDEVSVMGRYAESRGVPRHDITLDYAGFSTYESCYRLRPIFGVERAVLVTQSYHLPRAVYTCRALGIDAIGLGVPDWGRYSDILLARYAAREVLATAKALMDVHLARPLPTFLGPYEGIAEHFSPRPADPGALLARSPICVSTYNVQTSQHA
jgi:vancomycin permeability regulator SanA